MKKLSFLVLALGIFAFIPTKSYALFDINAYAGTTFAGDYESADYDYNVQDWGYEYGFSMHYTGSVLPILLSYGIGPYIQYNNIATGVDGFSEDADLKRTTIGLDFYLMANIAIVHPFVRVSVALWEGLREETVDGEVLFEEDSDYFKSYLFGIGVGVNVFPLVMIYAEYLYNTATLNGDDIQSNSIHLGVRVGI